MRGRNNEVGGSFPDLASAFAKRPRFLQEAAQRQHRASRRKFDLLRRKTYSVPEAR